MMAHDLGRCQSYQEVLWTVEVRHLHIGGTEGVRNVGIAPSASEELVLPGVGRSALVERAERGLGVEDLERVDQPGLERLKKYRWPGNIRELENLTRRLAALYPQEVITSEIVEAELRGNDPFSSSSPPEAGNSPADIASVAHVCRRPCSGMRGSPHRSTRR